MSSLILLAAIIGVPFGVAVWLDRTMTALADDQDDQWGRP